MRLIIGTSIIIAALINDSTSRTILLSDSFEFLAVDFTKFEIELTQASYQTVMLF